MHKLRTTLAYQLRLLLAEIGLMQKAEILFWRIKALFSQPGRDFLIQRQQRTAFYGQFVKKGSLCFDIGAHLGNRTDTFLELGAKVITIEPQSKCVRYLQKRYKFTSQVKVLAVGVADQVGELPIMIDTNDTVSSISTDYVAAQKNRSKARQYQRTELIPVTTLDHLIATYGKPDFCKIDVEGFEAQVLKGLSSPLPQVSFEFLTFHIQPAIDALRHLDSLGQYQYNYATGESYQLALGQPVDAAEMERLLRQVAAEKKVQAGDVYAFLVG